MTSKLFDKIFDKGADILKDKLKDKVGDKALEWAKNIPIIGELCDAAEGDTPEKQRTRAANRVQQSADAGQSEAMAAIARQQRILDARKDSINKMQDKINQQNGDLNKVWSDVNRAASKLESVGESLDGVKSSFLQLSADTKAGLQDFNWELRQLSETQESVKTQLDQVAKNMKSQVKLALAEQAVWEAQNNILKFYSEFQLHVSVAIKHVQRGDISSIGESRNIQAFIKAIRSPVSGVTCELFNLKCAYALLDNDPSSSRHALKESIKRAIATSRLKDDFDDSTSDDERRKNVEAEYSRGLQALIGAQLIAHTLIYFIAPNQLYRRLFSQAALDDLLTGQQGLSQLAPTSSTRDLTWLYARDGKAPSYKAWYLNASRSQAQSGLLRFVPGKGFQDGSPTDAKGVMKSGNRQELTWVMNPSPEDPQLFSMVTFRGDSSTRKVLFWDDPAGILSLRDETEGTNTYFKLIMEDMNKAYRWSVYKDFNTSEPVYQALITVAVPEAANQQSHNEAHKYFHSTFDMIEVDMKQQLADELEAWEKLPQQIRPSGSPPKYKFI